MKIDLRRIIKLAILLIGMGILLIGCESEKDPGDPVGKMAGAHKDSMASAGKPAPPPSNGDPAANEVQVVIENFVFSPAEVTVAPGTKVTWINKDDAPHTATSVDKKFNSGGLDTDDKFSFVFNEKGDYEYICTLHPHMKATIKVK